MLPFKKQPAHPTPSGQVVSQTSRFLCRQSSLARRFRSAPFPLQLTRPTTTRFLSNRPLCRHSSPTRSSPRPSDPIPHVAATRLHYLRFTSTRRLCGQPHPRSNLSPHFRSFAAIPTRRNRPDAPRIQGSRPCAVLPCRLRNKPSSTAAKALQRRLFRHSLNPCSHPPQRPAAVEAAERGGDGYAAAFIGFFFAVFFAATFTARSAAATFGIA